jgi:hypothetical protein
LSGSTIVAGSTGQNGFRHDAVSDLEVEDIGADFGYFTTELAAKD